MCVIFENFLPLSSTVTNISDCRSVLLAGPQILLAKNVCVCVHVRKEMVINNGVYPPKTFKCIEINWTLIALQTWLYPSLYCVHVRVYMCVCVCKCVWAISYPVMDCSFLTNFSCHFLCLHILIVIVVFFFIFTLSLSLPLSHTMVILFLVFVFFSICAYIVFIFFNTLHFLSLFLSFIFIMFCYCPRCIKIFVCDTMKQVTRHTVIAALMEI